MGGCHLWLRGPTQQLGRLGAGPMSRAASPAGERLSVSFRSVGCSASRGLPPPSTTHQAASPYAAATGLLKRTRAGRPPRPPPRLQPSVQGLPAKPGLPSPTPALALPRGGSHNRVSAKQRERAEQQLGRLEPLRASNTCGAGRRAES